MEQQRGRLKIFMGYAAGVGKTYKMLEEVQALKSEGVDIVVGYFEPHGRKETIEKAEGLEIVPRKQIVYRGSTFGEMDTKAILARRPRVCAVDEFPHTNIPGAERSKRWEDVETLLDAGIAVLTTMNIQHLESLNDQIRHITGVRVQETIPDWVVQQAHEIVMVDLTPRALVHRIQRGVVYEREKAERALKNFFRESTLVALRELALREAAHEVEQRIEHEASAARTGEAGEGITRPRHRILILVTPDPETAISIRRAKRVGDFLNAECFAVAVGSSGDLHALPPEDQESVERYLNIARNLRIETRILEGEDVAAALVDFARRNQITQIFLARPPEQPWYRAFSVTLVQRIVRLAKDIQIVIVSSREPVMHEAPAMDPLLDRK